MAKTPVALQLYSVREDCKTDLEDTLKAIAQMGYDGVEFAGYHNRGAAELRRILDDLGLRVAGAHTGLTTLSGDELQKTVEFHKTLGNTYLIVPSLPAERRNSRGAWLEAAGLFDEIAEKLAPEGMATGYHNHVFEFTPMEGELPWDTLFGNTRAEVVMQLDTGNALHGGADPVPFLEKYPGRAKTVHVKEYSKTVDQPLVGEGDVRWADVVRLCASTGGTEWYIVEQESYRYAPLECARLCLENFRRML